MAFTINGGYCVSSGASESSWATNIFNVANISADGKSTTMTTQRGYFFYYETDADNIKLWHEGKTDFYPASGYRHCGSGSLGDVGNYGICKVSSPLDASGSGGVFFFTTRKSLRLPAITPSPGSEILCVVSKRVNKVILIE